MNREERHRLLGDETIAYSHARVAEAPEPSPELVEELRRIMTRPAGTVDGEESRDPQLEPA